MQRGAVQIGEGDPVATDLDDLALLYRDHARGATQHRRDVRREDGLAVTDPHHERRRDLHADQDVRIVERAHDQGVRTLELRNGGAHGIDERGPAPGEPLLDQVRNTLRVGFRGEGVAGLLQTGSQVLEVLDDPVVDHGHPPCAVQVRMGVLIGRGAVRRPPRVTHPDGARKRSLLAQRGFQLAELAGPLHDAEADTVDHGDARRVVAAVFEPAKTLEDDR